MTAAADGGEATEGANGDLTGTTFAGLEVGVAVDHDLVSTSYRARDPGADDADAPEVALRVVAADLCTGEGEDRELYRRFHRHAAHALTFEHPNAPAIYEVGNFAGLGYLISAELDAVPFASYVEQMGPLDITAAVQLFEQVADVLDAGHLAGLTHGAVSPSTLQIVTEAYDDQPGTVQLTGYGIGDLLELRIRRDRKRLQLVDELLYVAPEQLRKQPPTGRTDQYAMACALVHALTGAPPFVRDSVGGLFGAHLFVAPRFEDHVASMAINKALSKEPRERYATCGQLIADVERARRSAANRRRAASRRRRVANEPPPAPVDGAVATAPPADRDSPVVDRVGAVPDHNGAAPGAEPWDDPVGAEATEATEGGRSDARGDDKSSTARQTTVAMSYPSKARGRTNGPAAANDEDGRDDVPLLSEVLSQREHGPQRTAWQPPGMWLAFVILILVAAAATVWLLGT